MRISAPYHLPEQKQRQLRRACRLEWITIGFMLTIVAVMYLSMGTSQAMKTAWIEDILSLVPPVAFLVAERFRRRHADRQFPWGYQRAALIAFLCGATALAMLGTYLLYDAVKNLVTAEHPTIGIIEILGHQIWLGWTMIAALLYSAIPPIVLGHLKLPLAEELYEKTLHADAAMNKADWMTAFAGILGVLGIGVGWWWADSVAAGVIALGISRDGFCNLSRSIKGLADQRPTPIGGNEPDPVVAKLRARVEALEWVLAAEVRLREQGRLITGEIALVPREEEHLLERLEEVVQVAAEVDWRLHDITVVPLRKLKSEDRSV